MTKVKSFLHKLIGLYLIGWFTTLWLAGSVLANGWSTNGGGFWVNAQNTAWIEGIGGIGTDAGDNIITVIKNFINYALGLVALVAFGFLVRWGYKMVASGGDEGAYKEGVQILKNAAIGIAFISVSWFLVTFIFFIIGAVTS